jgi:hypothetical protein
MNSPPIAAEESLTKVEESPKAVYRVSWPLPKYGDGIALVVRIGAESRDGLRATDFPQSAVPSRAAIRLASLQALKFGRASKNEAPPEARLFAVVVSSLM